MNIIERIRMWFVNLFTYEVEDKDDNTENQNEKNNSTSGDKEKGETETNTKKAKRKFRFPRINLHSFWTFFDRLSRGIVRCAVIGLILNVIVAYFYPELPEKIPVIYGWYDGWLQFVEFTFKAALGYINAFSHGTDEALKFLGELSNECQNGWMQFVNWLSTIHF